MTLILLAVIWLVGFVLALWLLAKMNNRLTVADVLLSTLSWVVVVVISFAHGNYITIWRRKP